MKRHEGQSGQAIVLLAVALIALLGFTGLVVDLGRGYSQRRSAEAQAEAAAHAATYKLQTSWDGTGFGSLTDAQVRATAKAYATSNGWDATNSQFFMSYIAGDQVTESATLSSSARGVLVQVSTPLAGSFTKAIGVQNFDVFGRGAAMFGSALTANAIPMGINDDSFSADGYYNQVGLQPANGSSNIGNYNFASIVPPPCVAGDLTCYINAMKFGSAQPITIPGTYPANSFDMSALAAASVAAIQYRIDQRPTETCGTAAAPGFTLPSPRVVFVPVINGNVGGSSVTLIRFRAFFISSIDTSHNPSGGFYGCFVKATASTGTFDPNAVGTGYGGATLMKLVNPPGSVTSVPITFGTFTSPNHPGAVNASSIGITTSPGALCTIAVFNPTASSAGGLAAKNADSIGSVVWTWTLDATAPIGGTGTAQVICSYRAVVGRGTAYFSIN